MSVILNRDAFLESEPEIDVGQFREVRLDLAYAEESPNQILDIFYPDEGEGPFPAVIVMHGGAFCAGHKRTHYIRSMCLPVTQGYAVVTVEYRLSQESRWPAQLIDGKAAIRYLRAHARELKLDPERFAVWGNSAGGTVTQLLAVSGDREECDDLSVGEWASSRVQCALAWYTISELNSAEQFGADTQEELMRTGAGKGMLPDGGARGRETVFTRLLGYNPLLYPERAVRVSPLSYVDESCPPMLLQHGTGDLVVDYHQSVYMYEKVTAVCGKGRARLELFEGEPHGSQVIKAKENISHCLDYLDTYLYPEGNPYRKPLTALRLAGEAERIG